MKSLEPNQFTGFPPQLFSFFEGLEKNNSKVFFDKHREEYEKFVVKPAKAFITTLAPFLEQLNPSIRREPKFNQTIMKLSKDMRFSKGVPYKTFLLVHFGRFKLDSEFYVYFDKSGVQYGMFLNNSKEENLFLKKNLVAYEKEIDKVFSTYGLNNQYSLTEMKKEMVLVRKKFDFSKDGDLLQKMKYILIEKPILLREKKIIASPNFINDIIKTFSRLYPLYCFAISDQPLKLLAKFEEQMGVAD
ncbi:MAG: DUF2461 family protein [Ignavibacteria bacterium]|nr:DUF2461 family protein [Ignavibacteria bacterium]